MRTGDHVSLARRSRLGLLLVLTSTAFVLHPPVQSFAQTREFVATGRAKLSGRTETAQRLALENALWLAVEQAVQTVVTPDARTEQAQALTGVLARPRKYITGYQVIQRGPSRGYFIIKVRASVAMNALALRLQALGVPVARVALEPQPARVGQAPGSPGTPSGAGAPSVEGGGSSTAQPPAAPSAPQPTSAPTSLANQSPPTRAAAPVQPQPNRPRIALIPFQLGFTNPQFTQTWDVSLGVTELVEEALFSSGRYRLVERRQLEQVLREQGIGNSATIDPATAAKVGRVLGVRAFVTGSVNQLDLKAAGGVAIPGVLLGLYRAQVELTARVIDTSTAEIIAIVRGTGQAEGVIASAQIQNLTFGGAEFRNSVLGKALDQAVRELVTKLNAAMPQPQ